MQRRAFRGLLAAFCLVPAFILSAQQTTNVPAKDQAGSLVVTASGHDSLRLTVAELKAMPHISVSVRNAHSNADETYSGVRVTELLSKVGAPTGDKLRGKALAQYIVASGSDGYQTVLAFGEADPSFHPGEVLVADAMDGKPLDAHNGPFKLIVSEDKHPARSVRNLVQIELRAVQ